MQFLVTHQKKAYVECFPNCGGLGAKVMAVQCIYEEVVVLIVRCDTMWGDTYLAP